MSKLRRYLLRKVAGTDGGWITTRASERILHACVPIMRDDACADCGGKWTPCSPPIVDHADDCPGEKRYRTVRDELEEAIYEPQEEAIYEDDE